MIYYCNLENYHIKIYTHADQQFGLECTKTDQHQHDGSMPIELSLRNQRLDKDKEKWVFPN